MKTILCLAALSMLAHAAPRLTDPTLVATLIQTAEKDGGYPETSSSSNPDRLAEYSVNFSSTKQSAEVTITLEPSASFQTVKGFGGAFTDAGAHVFGQLESKLQEEVIESFWGQTGQRYNLGRLTIGSTDFATGVYNYNENPGNLNQSEFSIEHDQAQLIPYIKRALAKSEGELQFVSSPWSPPGWMKRGWLTKKGYMRNSAKPGMIDDPKVYASYALYLSKYVSSYKAAGIPISMLTIQNEPDSADHMFPVAYPACNFNGTGEGEFLKGFLGPTMKKDHPELKILVHDGQKFHDVPILTRVQQIVTAAGPDFIHGVAFHWYGDNLQNYQYLADLHEKYPDLALLATEATLKDPRTQSVGTSPWKEAQKYAVDIIGDLNAHTEGWIEWNVLLDSSGGPTCIGPTATTACTPEVGHCDAPILANLKKQTLEYRDTYYIMGHFSRYIPRGSVIISASNDTSTELQWVAASTPAGDVVAVVLNTMDSGHYRTYQLEIGGQYLKAKVPGHGLHTIRFKNPSKLIDKND